MKGAAAHRKSHRWDMLPLHSYSMGRKLAVKAFAAGSRKLSGAEPSETCSRDSLPHRGSHCHLSGCSTEELRKRDWN